MRLTSKSAPVKRIYFAQKYPQNAGNAVSEFQTSKHFRARHTTRIVSSLWPSPHKNPRYATVFLQQSPMELQQLELAFPLSIVTVVRFDWRQSPTDLQQLQPTTWKRS